MVVGECSNSSCGAQGGAEVAGRCIEGGSASGGSSSAGGDSGTAAVVASVAVALRKWKYSHSSSRCGGGAQGSTQGGSADSLAPPDVDMGKAAVVAAVAMALKRRKEGGSKDQF